MAFSPAQRSASQRSRKVAIQPWYSAVRASGPA